MNFTPSTFYFILAVIVVFIFIRIIRNRSEQKTSIRPQSFPAFTPQKSVGKTGPGAISPFSPDTKASKSHRRSVILAIAFTVAGIVVTGFGIQYLRQGLDSKNWPETSGIVTASYAEHQISHRNSAGSSSDSYVARIAYTYTVNGINYTSREIGFGESLYTSKNRDKIETYLKQYPKKMEVTVYYNPANPHKAVLIPGITGGALLITAGGLFFLLVGVAFFIAMQNHKNQPV